MQRLVRVGTFQRTAAFVHVAVWVVCGLCPAGAHSHPGPTLAALLSYLGVIFVHEVGHVVMARRFRCASHAIEIHPIHGLTRHDPPPTLFARAAIAWGGVLAQMVVAAPFLTWLIVL